MKIHLPAKRLVVRREKPGPKKTLGGTRLNFLPGEQLRSLMLNLKAEAKRDFGIRLSQSYLLREGAMRECRKLQDLFEKARKGQLGPKRREQLLETVRV